MRHAASRLTIVTGMLAALGLAAQMAQGCAAGSEASDPDGGSSVDTDAGASNDSSTGNDAPHRDDSASSNDSGHDSGSGNDGGASNDSSANSDSSGDSSATTDSGTDSGPQVIFGSTCPTGTTYTEPFTSDPVLRGTFISLIGSYTFNSSTNTISLAAGNPNTQLWIGPRPSWTNYSISVPVRMDSANGNANGGINFRMQSTPASPANNAGQMYFAGIAPNQVMLGLENGSWTEFSGPSATFAVGTFYTLQVTAAGSSLSVSVNGTPYVTSYPDGTYAFGGFGLRAFSMGMTYGAITVTCN